MNMDRRFMGREAMSRQNTVVVLGGLGFAGSRICHALVRAGYCVRVFDRAGVSHFRLAEIADKVSFVEGDYSDANSVLAALGDSEIAVNLVHTTVPVSSMADPAADIRDNIEATVGWLKRLNETRIRRLLYFSRGS